MKKIFAFIFALIACVNSLAQQAIHSMSDGQKRIYYSTVADAEKKLIECYMENSEGNWYEFPFKMFCDLVLQDERTFNYSFDKIAEIEPHRFNIVKSEDNRLKLYWWNTGETMTYFEGITSISDGKDVFSYESRLNDEWQYDGPFPHLCLGALEISKIYNIDKKPIYLISSYAAGSTRMIFNSISACELNGLIPYMVNVFKHQNGSLSHEISCDFDPNVFNSFTDNRINSLIDYLDDHIFAMSTRYNDLNPYAGALPTGKYNHYKWNGKMFVYSGDNDPNLNPDLCNYSYKIFSHIFSDRFRIRIDKMPDGSYRYTSWNMPKTELDDANLVVGNGYEDIEIIDGDEYEKKVKYVFRNYAYTYIVSWVSDYSNFRDYKLEVRKNNTPILTLED